MHLCLHIAKLHFVVLVLTMCTDTKSKSDLTAGCHWVGAGYIKLYVPLLPVWGKHVLHWPHTVMHPFPLFIIHKMPCQSILKDVAPILYAFTHLKGHYVVLERKFKLRISIFTIFMR